MNVNDLTTGLTERLENSVQHYRNEESKSLLRQLFRLQFSSSRRNLDDILGQLLLRAVNINNYQIIEHLIDLGVDVDYSKDDGYTALMLAVHVAFEQSANLLLKANANLDALNPEGLTPLQMIFELPRNFFPLFITDELTELVLTRVKAGNNDVEVLVNKLMAAGCTLYHAAYLKNLRIIECMFNNGVDINSKCTPHKMTVLHAAVQLCDSNLIKWLLDRGADIHALDVERNSPLHAAAKFSSAVIMRILLERGANPNVSNRDGRTVLSEILLSDNRLNEECLQLLFDYNAIPQNVLINSYLVPILEIAFSMQIHFKINMLIDYVMVMKLLGNPVAESFLRYNENIRDFAVVQRRLELCEENLKCKRFGKLSMLELLTDGEPKMRVHARNEDLVTEVREFCLSCANRKMFPYYCFTLGRRISRMARLVKLENAVIPVVCGIINGNYNECYVPARNIVGYLSEIDLKMFSSKYYKKSS